MYDIAANGLKLVSKPLFGRGSLDCVYFFVVKIIVEVGIIYLYIKFNYKNYFFSSFFYEFNI